MSVMIHSCMVFFCKYCCGLFNYSTWLFVNLVEFKLQTPFSKSQFPAETFFISLSLVRYFEFTLFIYNSTIAVYLLKAYEQILSSVSVALSFLCTFTNSQLL